ncbi:Mobile element protein [Cupriavidus necator H850]|nr:Mobile element protein [Cupriavidus necator H850]
MTLCWSRHQYVELVRDQTIATWLQCHRHAFEWFHGVPARLIIDNPKCAIIRACLYEPNVQRAYAQCAEGYGFRIDPCPPRDPQKKGIVESGVKYVKNSFGPLRDFRDLADANRQVRAWVMAEAGIRIHGRPGVPVSRPCPRPPRSRPPTPPAARPAGVASGAPARAPASARCQSTTRPGLTLTSALRGILRSATGISAIRGTHRSRRPRQSATWRTICKQRSPPRCATARCWPPSQRDGSRPLWTSRSTLGLDAYRRRR